MRYKDITTKALAKVKERVYPPNHIEFGGSCCCSGCQKDLDDLIKSDISKCSKCGKDLPVITSGGGSTHSYGDCPKCVAVPKGEKICKVCNPEGSLWYIPCKCSGDKER